MFATGLLVSRLTRSVRGGRELREGDLRAPAPRDGDRSRPTTSPTGCDVTARVGLGDDQAARRPRPGRARPLPRRAAHAEGERLALEVLRHHRLLELYLAEHLGVPWDRVHEEAEALEHVLSEDLEARIAAKLGNPTHDPHGDPIPDAELHIDESTHAQPGRPRARRPRPLRARLGLRPGDAALPVRARRRRSATRSRCSTASRSTGRSRCASATRCRCSAARWRPPCGSSSKRIEPRCARHRRRHRHRPRHRARAGRRRAGGRVAGRRPEPLQEVVAAVEARRPRLAVSGDLWCPTTRRASCARRSRRSAACTSVVNNAGSIRRNVRLHEVGVERWDELIAANLRGPVPRAARGAARAAARGRRPLDRQRVLDAGGQAGARHRALRGGEGRADLADPVRRARVRARRHPLQRRAAGGGADAARRTSTGPTSPSVADAMADAYPLGRLGEPEDVAAAIRWLVSPGAGWITGRRCRSTAASQ